MVLSGWQVPPLAAQGWGTCFVRIPTLDMGEPMIYAQRHAEASSKNEGQATLSERLPTSEKSKRDAFFGSARFFQ